MPTSSDAVDPEPRSVLATPEHIARGPWLDPEIVPLATTAPIRNLLEDDQLAAFRAQSAMLPEFEVSPDVEMTDHPVNEYTFVRVFRPPRNVDAPMPALYSIHGGGMIMGSASMDNFRFDRLCRERDVVGVSIEYRLPPETPYPGPLDDCNDGWNWTVDHADELGIDPARIGVTGGSAGGGLAAGLALRLRDQGAPMPQFLLLDVPMIDDRQVTPSSRHDGLLVWTRESNEFGWRSYLGDLYGTDDVPAEAAPARSTDLSGLPPTYVSAGTADGFCDEDVDFAVRLMRAGVPTELHVFAGAPHGVGMFAGTNVAGRMAEASASWLANQFDARS